MFNKILIANRGEIACRVIKTARRLGIATVAVYSDADADALHVQMADEAIGIGPAAPAESYLRMDRIIAAASSTGAQAIHPGYGFLSENAQFSGMCAEADISFIGPPVDAIRTMGSKSAAKQAMEAAGVPLLPGYHGADQTPAVLQDAAARIGYPVLLKAVAGGGGKGMRAVHEGAEFGEALAAAQREAQSGFGDQAMLVEKYLAQPRHVEVQVFCDQAGAGVYLFERDCSIQRRHQKVLEEAPAPNFSETLRRAMGEAALRAAQAVDYVGAGTVEFLLDTDGQFYFMEMNTRLQVEHPVTEMITGQDLVEWQLRVAAGEPLPCVQEDLVIHGHAIEARVYAEDPHNNFLPAAGEITLLREPSPSAYVRIDTGVVEGDSVGVYYDPMIAKLITWDLDRERALQRMAAALASYAIAGVRTNLTFLGRVVEHEAFKAADLSTGFIAAHESALLETAHLPQTEALPLATLFLHLRTAADVDGSSPWHRTDHWRVNAPNAWDQRLHLDGIEHELRVTSMGAGELQIESELGQVLIHGRLQGDALVATLNGHVMRALVAAHGEGFVVQVGALRAEFAPWRADLGDQVGDLLVGGFNAPMNGAIVSVLVEPGQAVAAGDTLVIMEAMKMEHAIKAPVAGEVTEIFYAPGDLVEGGAPLLGFVGAA